MKMGVRGRINYNLEQASWGVILCHTLIVKECIVPEQVPTGRYGMVNQNFGSGIVFTHHMSDGPGCLQVGYQVLVPHVSPLITSSPVFVLQTDREHKAGKDLSGETCNLSLWVTVGFSEYGFLEAKITCRVN